MSRRKQSNPKPLLKNEGENSADEMALSQDKEGENSPPPAQLPLKHNDNGRSSSADIRKSISPNSIETGSQSLSNCSSPSPNPSPTTLPPPLPLLLTSEMLSNVQKQLPKLRLNTILASDPALQPEAKDIFLRSSKNSDSKSPASIKSCMDDDSGGDLEPVQLSSDRLPKQYVISDGNLPVIVPSKSRPPSAHSVNAKTSSTVGGSSQPPAIELIPRIPIFSCLPCGIKFSSLSTLEAHQTYYCTHNRKDQPDELKTGTKSTTGDEDGSLTVNDSEPLPKNIKTGKQYACSHCSYSADKKVSLNRHMRMHQSSPSPTPLTATNGDECSSSQQIHQIDRYCTECDIRFSSTKTYRAHKQHYCSGRHRDGNAPQTQTFTKQQVTANSKIDSQSPSETTTSPPNVSPPTQPYFALPTTPVLIIPCSLIQRASILPEPLSMLSPGLHDSDSICYTYQNGKFKPIANLINATADHSKPRQQTPNPLHTEPTKISVQQSPQPIKESSSTQKSTEILKCIRKKEVMDQNSSQAATGSVPITSPLDLSIRRLPNDNQHLRERSHSLSSNVSGDHYFSSRLNLELLMESKENLSLGSSGDSVTPEQIVCAPSLPGSPPLTPSPKRTAHSPRVILSSSPIPSPNLLQPIPAAMLRPLLPKELVARLTDPAININTSSSSSASNIQSIDPNMILTHKAIVNVVTSNKKTSNSTGHHQNLQQPQIFVKQGVSKCKECNIVFCKLENYLAHKQHYCSARITEDKDESGRSTPSKPDSSVSNPLQKSVTPTTAGTTLAYQQLICAACGIKFTSLDNLSAHQMYYCPKRIELPVQVSAHPKDKCSKCKNIHEPGLSCPATAVIHKCPICDVISNNGIEARRHMDTHAGVKAFRCSICRYKGNTLRGMRTHIRTHFDKKTLDINDDHYISCILEDEESLSPSISNTLNATTNHTSNTQSIESATVQMLMHFCDKCNYSSSYKGNVIRHMKLVHMENSIHPQSSSPNFGEGGESLIYEDESQKQSSSAANVIIKVEPTDDDKTDELQIIKINDIPNISNSNSTLKIESTIQDIKYFKDIKIDITDTSNLTTEPIIGQKAVIESTVVTPNPTTKGLIPLTSEQKYCSDCDIKFNYMNTFIAHKQFYCKGVKHDLSDKSSSPIVSKSPPNSVVSPSPTTIVSRPTETSV